MTEKTNSLEYKGEKLLTVLTVLILAAFFVVFAILNFAGFERLSQTDVYEDTLIAKLMWDQKTLFPKGYTFGNQFYIIATPVIAALFYGITGSPNTGMALATTLMSALIVLSFFWMIKPFVKSRLAALGALLTLVACVFSPYIAFAERGQLLFILCSYYACYTITLFFVLGDYIRARKSGEFRLSALIIALLLCFATGMQSLRQTCIMTLPLLAMEAAMLLRARLEAGRFLPQSERAPLVRAAAYFAANLAGVVFIKLLNIPQQTIFALPPYESRFSLLKKALGSITGFDAVQVTGNPVFAAMLVFYLLLLISAAVIVLRRIKAAPLLSDCCWVFLVISIAAVIAASVFTSVSVRDIYLFVYFPLLAMSFLVVYEQLGIKLKRLLAAVLCVLAVCNIPLSYGDDLKEAFSEDEPVMKQISELALSEGCEYVYGALDGSAPGVAVWADGRLIAGGWESEIIFKVVPYLNMQNIYHLEDYAKAIFVFRRSEMDAAMTEIAGNGAKLTVLAEYDDYIVCRSSQQLLYPLTWDWQWQD